MTCSFKLKITIKCVKSEGDIKMEKKELVNLTESELLSINGGTGFLSKVGELIGDGLAMLHRD